MKNQTKKPLNKKAAPKSKNKSTIKEIIDLEENDFVEDNIEFIEKILYKISQHPKIKPAFDLPEEPSIKEVINLDDYEDVIEIKKEEKAITKFGQKENMSQEASCSICLFQRKNMLKYNCGHEICPKCAKRWKKVNKTCPFCRCEI
jgi:hypothetical protein